MNPDGDTAFNFRDDITTTTVPQKDDLSMVCPMPIQSLIEALMEALPTSHQPPGSEYAGSLNSGESSFWNDDNHDKDGNSGGEE